MHRSVHHEQPIRAHVSHAQAVSAGRKVRPHYYSVFLISATGVKGGAEKNGTKKQSQLWRKTREGEKESQHTQPLEVRS